MLLLQLVALLGEGNSTSSKTAPSQLTHLSCLRRVIPSLQSCTSASTLLWLCSRPSFPSDGCSQRESRRWLAVLLPPQPQRGAVLTPSGNARQRGMPRPKSFPFFATKQNGK